LFFLSLFTFRICKIRLSVSVDCIISTLWSSITSNKHLWTFTIFHSGDLFHIFNHFFRHIRINLWNLIFRKIYIFYKFYFWNNQCLFSSRNFEWFSIENFLTAVRVFLPVFEIDIDIVPGMFEPVQIGRALPEVWRMSSFWTTLQKKINDQNWFYVDWKKISLYFFLTFKNDWPVKYFQMFLCHYNIVGIKIITLKSNISL
jgi:hypothetical protein